MDSTSIVSPLVRGKNHETWLGSGAQLAESLPPKIELTLSECFRRLGSSIIKHGGG